MDKIERAKEFFRALEEKRPGQVAEIARRTFLIQQRLSDFRD